jgi:hypothetical protein
MRRLLGPRFLHRSFPDRRFLGQRFLHRRFLGRRFPECCFARCEDSPSVVLRGAKIPPDSSSLLCDSSIEDSQRVFAGSPRFPPRSLFLSTRGSSIGDSWHVSPDAKIPSSHCSFRCSSVIEDSVRVSAGCEDSPELLICIGAIAHILPDPQNLSSKLAFPRSDTHK